MAEPKTKNGPREIRLASDALLNQDKRYDYGMLLPFKTRRGMDEDQLSTDYMEGDISPAVPELFSDMYNASVKGGQMVQGERKIEPFEVTKIAAEFLPGAMAVNSTASKGMKGAILGANVFQGGPHKYGPEGAARSLDHMGKGEGAQAYGYGRYDAGAEGVARQYADTMGEYVLKGPNGDTLRPSEIFAAGDESLGDAVKAISSMPPDEGVKWLKTVGLENEANTAQRLIDEGYTSGFSSGHLYKHDLPDDAIARYLDHDKPLSEQPEVFGQLKRHWDETMGDPDIIMQRMGLTENSSGKDLYQALAGLGRDGKAASEALGRAGIPGLKYYDGMSRGRFGVQLKHKGKDYTDDPVEFATKQQADDYLKESVSKGFEAELVDLGTRNYVTWDQDVLDRMKLLERNGESMIDALR